MEASNLTAQQAVYQLVSQSVLGTKGLKLHTCLYLRHTYFLVHSISVKQLIQQSSEEDQCLVAVLFQASPHSNMHPLHLQYFLLRGHGSFDHIFHAKKLSLLCIPKRHILYPKARL